MYSNLIYVTLSAPANAVAVINGNTDRVVTTIPVGVNPLFIAVNSLAHRAYVANASSGTVSVIGGGKAVIATIPVGGLPFGLRWIRC